MATLGTTRYSLGLTYNEDGKTISKTSAGFNFASGSASAIAAQANLFVRGNKLSGGSFPGLKAFAGDGIQLTDVDVIARNPVEL